MEMQMSTEKKERDMGVELLRIISMLMIVVMHILGQGGILAGVAAAPGSAGYAGAYLLEAGAYMAINCYALISGYVGVEHPFRYARLFETQARVLFYTVFITAGFCIVMPELFGFTLVKNALFPAMTGQYWYYTAYFGLMLFMPALQCMIAHLKREQFRNMIIGIVLLFSVLPMLFVSDIFQTAQGYSLWWLTALYLIGAYIKKFGCPFLKKPLPALAVYALCVFATWGIRMAEAYGAGIPLPNMLAYTSPAMLLAGVSLFVVFSGLRLPASVKKAVGLCAPLSFSVYLIHAHPLVWKYLFEGRFAAFADYPVYMLIPAVIGAAAAVYAVCTLIDAVRVWLFRMCRVRKGCKWMEERIKGLLYGMDLYLQKVRQTDMDLLYQWANDPDVRKMAFHTETIPYEDHVKYFTKLLADASAHQYIMYQGELPIGQIRLNVEGNEALIDYSIAAGYRGKGYGSELLQLVKKQVVTDRIENVTKLVGQVKYENPASASVFEKCGFTKREMQEYIQYEFWL